MDPNRILITMRLCEWEKSKAHLKSMLSTFWDNDNNKYDKMTKAVNDFIEGIEEEIGI